MKSSRPDAEVAAGEEATLQTLQFEGPEIHPALRTRPLDDTVRHLRQGFGMPEKPHIFLPADVVKTISHGRLNATGIQSVLDALYVQEHEPGCCGMDTETLLEPCFLSRHQTSLAGWCHRLRHPHGTRAGGSGTPQSMSNSLVTNGHMRSG